MKHIFDKSVIAKYAKGGGLDAYDWGNFLAGKLENTFGIPNDEFYKVLFAYLKTEDINDISSRSEINAFSEKYPNKYDDVMMYFSQECNKESNWEKDKFAKGGALEAGKIHANTKYVFLGRPIDGFLKGIPEFEQYSSWQAAEDAYVKFLKMSNKCEGEWEIALYECKENGCELYTKYGGLLYVRNAKKLHEYRYMDDEVASVEVKGKEFVVTAKVEKLDPDLSRRVWTLDQLADRVAEINSAEKPLFVIDYYKASKPHKKIKKAAIEDNSAYIYLSPSVKWNLGSKIFTWIVDADGKVLKTKLKSTQNL